MGVSEDPPFREVSEGRLHESTYWKLPLPCMAPSASLKSVSPQVLSKEEYACWLQSHIEAEASVESREELLFQSAVRLETNLHLLGN